MNVQFPRILRPLMGKLTWRKHPSSKVIYLTFDDGPVPEVTPDILDILDKYHIKATFFCVGENVQKHPELYQEVLRRGHKTGNHTFNHLKGYHTPTPDYIQNVEKASRYIDSKLFRPPHGQIRFSQINQLKNDYDIIMWDIITHDYNRQLSADTVFGNVRRMAPNYSIIVFHDSIKAQQNVLSALPRSIEYLKEKGFEFATL